jgi:hypothetical protein
MKKCAKTKAYSLLNVKTAKKNVTKCPHPSCPPFLVRDEVRHAMLGESHQEVPFEAAFGLRKGLTSRLLPLKVPLEVISGLCDFLLGFLEVFFLEAAVSLYGVLFAWHVISRGRSQGILIDPSWPLGEAIYCRMPHLGYALLLRLYVAIAILVHTYFYFTSIQFF